jgi:hypothetical protein
MYMLLFYKPSARKFIQGSPNLLYDRVLILLLLI